MSNANRTPSALSRARTKTFDQFAAEYIKAHRGSWKSAKHAAHWETSLANYASPVFGALQVSDVDTDLVGQVLRPIWNTKTETAVRLRGRIECIIDWATVSKYRQGENPARWRGHLENLLANPNKIAPVTNFPCAAVARDCRVHGGSGRSRRHRRARRPVCDPYRVQVGRSARRQVERDRSGPEAMDHPG